jgi:transcriptional regulator with XRE-family HTH domain
VVQLVKIMKVNRVIKQSIDVVGLGERIRQARINAKVSVIQLSRDLSVSRQYVNKIETEQTDLSEETLRKIEAVLGVDFNVKFD